MDYMPKYAGKLVMFIISKLISLNSCYALKKVYQFFCSSKYINIQVIIHY